jgi:hypothetical protein
MSNLPGVIRSSVTSKTRVSGVPEPENKGVSVSLKFAFPDYSGVQLRTSSCQFQALQITRKAKAVMCGALLHLLGKLCVIKIG